MRILLCYFVFLYAALPCLSNDGFVDFAKYKKLRKHDLEQAHKHLAISASLGNPEACWTASFVAHRNDFPFQVIAPTRDQARLKLLSMSPERDPRKWLYLGRLHFSSNDPKVADQRKALQYFTKHVDLGETDGFLDLAEASLTLGIPANALKYSLLHLMLERESLEHQRAEALQADASTHLNSEEIDRINDEVGRMIQEQYPLHTPNGGHLR